MIFPPCPLCSTEVTSTALAQGVTAVPADVLAEQVTSDVTMAARADSVPDGWRIVDPREPGAAGAPEFDVLTLSCGCELQGPDVWQFNADAVNRTWPDLCIELAVSVPAAALGEPVPRWFTKSTTVSAAELLADPAGVPAAIARYLSAAAGMAAEVFASAGDD